ncbi:MULTISPECIES: ABC transporter substrate-binding protein [Niallia]|uniref:ABC transporter substrate-binding protein n=1 Tax=Niallia hominis TaxID=3133173 RepID=A0ABV1EZ87_9BACI|nr:MULTISPECIES: ABC transporter substrate-binding protein [Niallia]MCF2649232.1 ABC transporter substrate-binding protein [Niallia circulans]
MKKLAMIISVLFLLISVGCSKSTGSEGTSSEDSYGGSLNIAISVQPPTLDAHLTTSSDAIEIMRNIYETLVTQNEDQQAVPMLAESIETSEDGLTYTFKLRKGMKFHNEKEMTSEDVVASMNRWLEQSSRAKLLLSGGKFEAVDEYTVTLKLAEAVTDVLDIMAGKGQFPAIMPSEVIAEAGKDGVTEYIGTGPLKFVEWKQDQYIKLEKFADYVASEEETSGLSGKKTVYIDDVTYHIVPDSSTRLAGIQTGEYDIANSMPFDNYEQLKNTPNLKTFASFDSGTLNVAYNKKQGIMTNPEIRKAINTGINANAIMLASFGSEDLYNLDPGYMSPEQKDWATDAGKEVFNLGDVEKAKQMLKDAGYNGEEIILYSTRDYDHQYNSSVVLKEQLEQMGVKVSLELYDWPTLTEKRANPENWDLLIVGTGYVTTPSQLLVVNPDYVGWTNDETMTNSLQKIRTASTKEEAKELWAEMQSYMWNDYVPYTLFGHYASIITATDKLEDFTVFQGPILWNVKKTQ